MITREQIYRKMVEVCPFNQILDLCCKAESENLQSTLEYSILQKDEKGYEEEFCWSFNIYKSRQGHTLIFGIGVEFYGHFNVSEKYSISLPLDEDNALDMIEHYYRWTCFDDDIQ